MMAYARSIIDGFSNHDRRLYHEVTDDELLGPRLKIMSEDRATGEDLQVEHEALHLTAEDAETIAAGYALLTNALRDGEAAPMLALDGADAERLVVAMRDVFADAGPTWAGSVLQRIAEAVAAHDADLRDGFARLADEVFALNAKAEDLQDAAQCCWSLMSEVERARMREAYPGLADVAAQGFVSADEAQERECVMAATGGE